MEQYITEVVSYITGLMNNFGVFSGFFLILLESAVPILPLGVFIALNIMSFGSVLGFVVSWVATVTGCMMSFFVCRKLRDKFDKKYGNNKQINNFKGYLNKISYSNLVLLLAMPFTPAFAVNIGAGLSDIDKGKYFSALMIGKLPMIYFWGFIGKSFLESISDPYTIAQIIVMLILAYFASKVIGKFLK